MVRDNPWHPPNHVTLVLLATLGLSCTAGRTVVNSGPAKKPDRRGELAPKLPRLVIRTPGDLGALTRGPSRVFGEVVLRCCGQNAVELLQRHKVRSLEGPRVTPDMAPRVPGLVRLTLTQLPADVAPLARAASLRTLVIAGEGHVDQDRIPLLVKLPRIRKLVLNGSDINDDDLVHLGAMRGLRELRLSGTRVQGPGLRHLVRVTHLDLRPGDAMVWNQRPRSESLCLTAEGFKALGSLVKLQVLRLREVKAPVVARAEPAPASKGSDRAAPRLGLLPANDSPMGLGLVSGDNQGRGSAEAMAALGGLTSLRELDLSMTAVDDRRLAMVAGMPRLQKLNLAGTGVTDAGLVHLAKLTSLVELDLSGTDVTDAGLVHLADLSALEQLRLGSTGTTDQGLRPLSRFPALRVLDINDSKVTGPGLVHLVGLARLEVLNLGSAKIDDAGLVHLRGMTRLEELNLSGSGVRGPGLRHLAKLRSLGSLNLQYTRVGSQHLAHLAGLTGLRELALGNTGVDDSGLAHLSSIDGLRILELDRSRVAGPGLCKLPRGLHQLKLSVVHGLSPSGKVMEVTELEAKHLHCLGRLTELRKLSLTGQRAVGAAAEAVLKRLHRLEYLELDDTTLGADPAAAVRLRAAFPDARVRVDKFTRAQAPCDPEAEPGGDLPEEEANVAEEKARAAEEQCLQVALARSKVLEKKWKEIVRQKGPGMLARLERGLLSRDDDVRGAVVEALAVKGPGGITLLRWATEDTDRAVSHTAYRALVKMGQAALPALEWISRRHPRFGQQAARAVTRLKE